MNQKIVIIGTVIDRIIKFRSNLIKQLVQKKETIFVLAIDYDEYTRKTIQELGGIPVNYNFNRTGLTPFKDLYNTLTLTYRLKQIKPDIIFTSTAKPVVFGTIAGFLSGCKRRIGMLEGLGYSFTYGPNGLTRNQKIIKSIQLFLYRLSLPLLERVILLNEDDYEEIINKEKIKVKKANILGGIGLDLMQYSYKKPIINPVSFLFIGRLLTEKGIYEYTRSAEIIKNKYPNTLFYIYGELDEKNPGGVSQEWINKVENEGSVYYGGSVNNIVSALSECSVFVLPSYREGMPRSTQEAMAVGRPVITTNVPGCRDTVIDGKNGFIVPPWSVQPLVECMEYFINNPDKIERMGLESYKIACDQFDEEKINGKIITWLLNKNSK